MAATREWRTTVATLHDRAARAEVLARLRALTPDSPRRWGRMSVDQMLWHVNQGLLAAMGELHTEPVRVPLPRSLIKAMVLRLPWPRGAPTAPEYVAKAMYEFEEQRQRTLDLVDAFTARELVGEWPVHAGFGRMTGPEWSRLMYRHTDHHLRQFSV